MNARTKIVISASRRTDIPAFYMEWFMSRVKAGAFEVVNPYNQRVSLVPAATDRVHTIVFWSKNFGPFLEGRYGEQLQKKGYHLFFNATVNSDSPILEPGVPPLTERLNQLKQLCLQFGSEAVQWRFDPICFFKAEKRDTGNNLGDFTHIAEKASEWGIHRCITSFMDHYPKIQKRAAARSGFAFIDPPLEKKLEIILKMEKELSAKNIRLFTCCEKNITTALPPESTVTAAACIPNDLFIELFGGVLSLRNDAGQRLQAGCGCKASVDIGSYRQQPCYHNCLFCYANPTCAAV